MSETGTTYGTGKLTTLGAGYGNVRLARCRGGLRLTFRHGSERHAIKVPMDRADQLRVFAAGKNAFAVLAEIAHDRQSAVEHTIESRRVIRWTLHADPGTADDLMEKVGKMGGGA